MTTIIENTVTDLTNNESAACGIFPSTEGTFLALTATASKEFKTRRGAVRWMAKRGFEVLTVEESNLRKAAAFGKMARRNETATAPAQCADMMHLIEEAGGEVGECLPLLKAWTKAFGQEHQTITNRELREAGFFEN